MNSTKIKGKTLSSKRGLAKNTKGIEWAAVVSVENKMLMETAS